MISDLDINQKNSNVLGRIFFHFLIMVKKYDLKMFTYLHLKLLLLGQKMFRFIIFHGGFHVFS